VNIGGEIIGLLLDGSYLAALYAMAFRHKTLAEQIELDGKKREPLSDVIVQFAAYAMALFIL
jgi:hypothetical protein